MHVFITGATGFVGAAIVRELRVHGHEVTGLARSEAGAKTLAATGAKILRGAMEEPASLVRGAQNADAVIHTAFNHDFSKFAENCARDRQSIETLGNVLAGSDRPLLVTSGLAMLAEGRPASETDLHADPDQFPRKSELAADALAARGIRAGIVRLAPSVHGDGDHGFVPHLIALARQTGISAYIGEGRNRWSAVHRLDAARLYRLALARTEPGSRFHATAEAGIAFRTIAETIAGRLGLPAVSLTPEQAGAHFGWFSLFAGMDAAARSEITRARLGWSPTGPGLLDDLAHGRYF